MTPLAVVLVIAQFCALVTLIHRGLGRQYPALIAYLAASVVRGSALGSLDPRTNLYLELWLWTLPAILTVQVLVGAECYRRTFSEVPGLASTMHIPIVATCSLAALGALFAGEPEFSKSVLWRIQRAVAISLFISCLGAGILVRILRPWRRANLVVHERILALHFLTIAGMTIWPVHGWINGLVSIACCASWALFLTPQGERSHTPGPGSVSQVPEAELNQIRVGLSSAIR